jgi:hypothetical protein
MSESQPTAPVSYRPIEGWPGYRVGDDGSVWSCKQRGRWHRLFSSLDSNGYERVALWQGRGRTIKVHVLVLTAFVGPRPDDMESCHNNGNRADNRLCNLRWDTRSNNAADRNLHGTATVGVKHPRARLNDADVQSVRHQLATGEDPRGIARTYGVSYTTIMNIKHGVTWCHVPYEADVQHAAGGNWPERRRQFAKCKCGAFVKRGTNRCSRCDRELVK